MGNYNFHKDLAVAKKCEEAVAEFLQLKGCENVEFCEDKKWDIYYTRDGKAQTLEIKEDFMSKKTGNVAIEFESRGKSSGIKTSEADMWLYVLGERYYMAPRKRILAELLRNKFPIVRGGDSGTSKMFLISFEDFKKLFIRVK